MVETTEREFRSLCKKNSLEFIRLMVSGKTTYIGQSMPGDYLVFTGSKFCIVELKEVSKGTKFERSRFRQQYKMIKLSEKKTPCYLIIHFKNPKQVLIYDPKFKLLRTCKDLEESVLFLKQKTGGKNVV